MGILLRKVNLRLAEGINMAPLAQGSKMDISEDHIALKGLSNVVRADQKTSLKTR
jgi:hypothetical protein